MYVFRKYVAIKIYEANYSDIYTPRYDVNSIAPKKGL